jgi:hypothetical protein
MFIGEAVVLWYSSNLGKDSYKWVKTMCQRTRENYAKRFCIDIKRGIRGGCKTSSAPCSLKMSIVAVIPGLQGGDNGTSDYSHGMGFINMFGWDATSYFDFKGTQRTYIGNVINDPGRGDTILFLNDTSTIR